jgi:hypothetical protein
MTAPHPAAHHLLEALRTMPVDAALAYSAGALASSLEWVLDADAGTPVETAAHTSARAVLDAYRTGIAERWGQP